jgi:hypothetical protein
LEKEEGTMAKDKVLTGAAGAYYVGFRLSALGYAVGLTTHGTRAIDMFVANPDTVKSITIQTKTMLADAFRQSGKLGNYWGWPVGKSPQKAHETFFYAFVDLRGDPSKTPHVFIVPSVVLAPLLEDNKGWLWCCIYEKDQDSYLERWDVIRDALA